MWSSGSHLKRVCAAATDGRTSNVRFIQSQLKALHQSILETRVEIVETISSDQFTTEVEAKLEFALAIGAVKQHYDTIDFDHAIAKEYRIARGENNIERRVGHGVVLIKPTTHTRFYSIISAVACAIAAGNTFVVECDDIPIDALLYILFQSMDWELYGLVQGSVTSHEILSTALVIDQTGAAMNLNCVKSIPTLPSIAVVERTADVIKAAKEILSANLAFSGQSPHAPNLVIVNEWIKKEFIDTVLREDRNIDRELNFPHNRDPEWKKSLAEAQAKGEATLVESHSVFIVDVKESSSPLIAQRGSGRCLTLLTVASLADAVLALSFIPKYLTAYHFAKPDAGKFLSQHIDSHFSFINHIPVEILVGPALPLKQSSFSHSLRYTTEMLSRPRPEIIQPIENSNINLEDLANLGSSKLRLLEQKAANPLKGTGQGPGTAIGFFEQGIVVGALFIVLPVISAVGYSTWVFTQKFILPNAPGISWAF